MYQPPYRPPYQPVYQPPYPIDISGVESPCYICDLGALRRNLEVLAQVQDRAQCKILLALKGFAMWRVFPLVRQYLSGVAASSPHEARLGREEYCPDGAGEVHVYAPAYSGADMDELITLADHIVFNSVAQWRRFRPAIRAAAYRIECGLRINPQHSEVPVALYDPCGQFSRLGTPSLPPVAPEGEICADLDGITGLHFHTLCQLGADALERTITAVVGKFGDHLRRMQWVNFGGGHHISKPDYDLARLVRIVTEFRDRYGVEVYLEPGEAIAVDTGILVASVLDIVHNEMDIAILDTSATAHMPDVIEMPYRPEIVGAGQPGEYAHTYRLGGLTCLAGDIIGDYSFAEPLEVGSKLVFTDMIHYTMVKNTTFNGVRLPSIALYDPDSGTIEVVRHFTYEDYKHRLS